MRRAYAVSGLQPSQRGRHRLLLGGVLAAAFALTFMVLTPVTESEAATPGLVGKIAYVSTETGDREIFVAEPDGTGRTNLTNNGAEDREPAWSYDGTMLAFASDRNGELEIFTMDPDGTNVTATGAAGSEPAWSLDGRILFNCGDPVQICIMDADGSNQSTLTPDTHWAAAPKVSPDGSKIAYSSTPVNPASQWNVWMMDLDGTNAQQLTVTNFDFVRAWSPDGSQILFNSTRDTDWGLFVMDAEGGNQQRLVDAFSVGGADFSPDGNHVIYQTPDPDDSALWLADADGSSPQLLIDEEGAQEMPAWQPLPVRTLPVEVTFAGVPLADVEVWLAENAGSSAQTSRYGCTDSTGRVEFDNVRVGITLMVATGPSVQQAPCGNADFTYGDYQLVTHYTPFFTIGLGGGDVLFEVMAMCEGEPATIQGTFDDDTLVGTPGRDVIVGLDGDDIIKGQRGNDLMCGGAGNDLIRGLTGNDVSYGGPGDDRIQDGPGDDVLYGGDGKDKMWGGIDADILYGGEGNDQLHGGRHNDDLYGGGGTDRIWGDADDDNLYGEAKSDFLYGGIGIDWMWGGDGNDRLFGWTGDDFLYGEDGKDQLRGQDGEDANDGGDHYDWCSVETIWLNCEKEI